MVTNGTSVKEFQRNMTNDSDLRLTPGWGQEGQYDQAGAGNALAHDSNKAVKLHHYSQIFMVRLKQIIILNKTFCRSFTTYSSTPLSILMFIRL